MKCKYCGAEIDFVKRAHGKGWIPVDAQPVLYLGRGATEVLTPTGETRRVHVVTEGPRCGLYIGYLPHWRNCAKHQQTEDAVWWQKIGL